MISFHTALKLLTDSIPIRVLTSLLFRLGQYTHPLAPWRSPVILLTCNQTQCRVNEADFHYLPLNNDHVSLQAKIKWNRTISYLQIHTRKREVIGSCTDSSVLQGKDTHTTGQILLSHSVLSLERGLKFSARDWLLSNWKHNRCCRTTCKMTLFTEQKLISDSVMSKAFAWKDDHFWDTEWFTNGLWLWTINTD